MSARILIVDDNENNISLMEILLKHAGCSVVSAANGAEGLDAALKEHPDLILMDIQMPDMNGFQAACEILANECTRNIPIIGISAYASPASRERALRIGMAGFLEKPINCESFAEQVRHFLPQAMQ